MCSDCKNSDAYISQGKKRMSENISWKLWKMKLAAFAKQILYENTATIQACQH